MKKSDNTAEKTAHNVIPLHLNAEFYFERAMQSLDRCHYEKALKYFRRAVETEPDHAVHHINLAGVLSETGDYEASNEILQYVLESLDPNMTECHFYMANNYLNMDMLEQSEEALLRYLELDEQGLYMDEAEELLELLAMELGRPIPVKHIRSRAALFEHDRARVLLEEGQFNEAVQLLEKLSKQHPEFIAARNNLALAYYYMGQLDRAVRTVEEVLEEDPGNLHALCNLSILLLQLEQHDQLQAIMRMLKKLVPMGAEHSFKLATTMGILGEHETAYWHFKRLLITGNMEAEPSLYHYTAVAAAHLRRYDEARRLWQQVKKLDPETTVADYYLQRLEQFMERSHEASPEASYEELLPLSYNYHLPFEEQFKWFTQPDGSISEHIRRDPVVRSSFFWVLRYGDYDAKLQVIQALGMLGDDEVEQALREFIQRDDEADELKKAAVMVLNAIGAEGPLHVVLGGRKIELQGSPASAGLPVWEPIWQDVLDIALAQMEKHYDMVERYDMQTLWKDFLSRTYPKTPHIRRPEGWSAALEYLIAKMHRRQVTFPDVAERYGISVSTVRRNVAEIDSTCGLRKKMEAILPQLGGKI